MEKQKTNENTGKGGFISISTGARESPADEWKPPQLASPWDVYPDLQAEWDVIVWGMERPQTWEDLPKWED